MARSYYLCPEVAFLSSALRALLTPLHLSQGLPVQNESQEVLFNSCARAGIITKPCFLEAAERVNSTLLTVYYYYDLMVLLIIGKHIVH